MRRQKTALLFWGSYSTGTMAVGERISPLEKLADYRRTPPSTNKFLLKGNARISELDMNLGIRAFYFRH